MQRNLSQHKSDSAFHHNQLQPLKSPGESSASTATAFPFRPPAAFIPAKLYGRQVCPGSASSPCVWHKVSSPTIKYLPNLIHISIFDTNHLDIAMQEHLDAWITLNPEFTVVLYNDTNMLEFIHDISVYNPNILATFNALRNVVEKTDYWRYLIAYYFGGVYADSDIENFTPIKYWPCWEDDKVRVAVGIENSFIDENVRRESRHTHMTQITQWTFAAAPRNNLIRRAAELVGLNVEKERNGYPFPPAYDTDLQILYRTGPGVFTDATLDHIAQFNYRGYDIGQGDVRMGDVYILNLNAFRTELVYHHFFGSWKSEETTNRETEVVGTFGGGAAVDGISHDDKGVASTPDT